VQFDEAERVRFAAEAAGIGTWDWDLDRDVRTCSKTCARLHGARTGEALKYRDFNALLHEDDRERVEAAFSAVMATGVLDVEYRVVRTGGGAQWLHARGLVPPDGKNCPKRGMTGVVVDIDQRKLTEQELRAHKQHLQSILDTVPDAMIVIDDDGVMQSFSAAAEWLTIPLTRRLAKTSKS